MRTTITYQLFIQPSSSSSNDISHTTPTTPLFLFDREIIGRKGPFGVLKDPVKNAEWEQRFLEFLAAARMVLFIVVIDKVDHLSNYGSSAYHPYHYCFGVLLERLRGWLNYCGGTADVMAESRGTVEDRELCANYQEIRTRGSRYIAASEFQKVLTSKDLKLRKKQANIAGLQIADLLAAPSKMDVLSSNGQVIRPPSAYDTRLDGVTRRKFNLYGRVFLD